MRLAVVALVLLFARDAVAESQAKQIFEEGQRLYHESRYLEAADRFAAAFKLEPDPAYIYNAAQAYRAGNACARAAAAYRKFEVAVPNPPEPDKLRGHIEEMDACAAEQRLAPPPPDPKLAPSEPPPVGPEPPRERPPEDAGNAKRTVGIVAGLAGVALVGTAIYFSLDARSLARQYDDECKGATPMQPCDGAILADYDRRGRRAEIFATAGYILGGVALAGGVTLFALGRKEQRESTLSLRPTSGGAMVTTRWRF